MGKMNITEDHFLVLNAVIDGDAMWFTSGWYNYLFKLDIVNNLVVKAIRLPVGTTSQTVMCEYMFRDEKCIYLLLRDANKRLVKYDLESGQLSQVNFSLDIEDWGDCKCETNDCIYFGIKEKKQIVCLHKTDLSIDRINVTCEGKGIQLICKIETGFVIMETGVGDIVITDEDFKIKKRYKVVLDNFEILHDQYYPGAGVVLIDTSVVVFPKYANMIYQMDLETGSCSSIGNAFIDKLYVYDKYGPKFSFVKRIDNRIYTYLNHEDAWYVYDEKCELERIFRMKLSDPVHCLLQKENSFENHMSETKTKIYREQKYFYTLKNFIDSLD